MNLPLCQALFTETVVLRHFWDDSFNVPHIAPRALRHTTRFEVPRMSTRYGRRQRIFYVPDIFNSLPERVLDLDSNKKVETGPTRPIFKSSVPARTRFIFGTS